jgi:hypothetical protein
MEDIGRLPGMQKRFWDEIKVGTKLKHYILLTISVFS